MWVYSRPPGGYRPFSGRYIVIPFYISWYMGEEGSPVEGRGGGMGYLFVVLGDGREKGSLERDHEDCLWIYGKRRRRPATRSLSKRLGNADSICCKHSWENRRHGKRETKGRKYAVQPSGYTAYFFSRERKGLPQNPTLRFRESKPRITRKTPSASKGPRRRFQGGEGSRTTLTALSPLEGLQKASWGERVAYQSRYTPPGMHQAEE